ncbi:MAG: aspartate ammonia-lyase [Planctomycetes bacterium]|nr:aspartate ammonia-lyase [Planctomycetota bacterium]
MRTERDYIGEIEIPDNALYGINSKRAKNAFPHDKIFNINWYKSLGIVKKAIYLSYSEFVKKLQELHSSKLIPITEFSDEIINAMCTTCDEIAEGKHFENFIVPAVSGGAGTAINLNMNESIANSSLVKLNKICGEYKYIHPIEHANIFQSTNDVVPTALKVAIIRLLNELEVAIDDSRMKFEKMEKQHRDTLRIAYTQMQEAVPSSFGRLFSTYQEALSRDWWRISKCFERIKVVNLGGSAIGSGITVPKYVIFKVIDILRELTDLPITRGDNLQDNTVNFDSFVEIHGILKSHAVNLEKIASDFRLLTSDIFTSKAVNIKPILIGSSIMPGKVNPVISEFIISICHKIYANDNLISSLSAQGCLDLNAYLPIIGDTILNSLENLINCNKTMRENLLIELTIDKDVSLQNLLKSPTITTVLVSYVGYEKAQKLALFMKENNCDIYEANKHDNVISEEILKRLLSSTELLKLGFSVNDILGAQDGI